MREIFHGLIGMVCHKTILIKSSVCFVDRDSWCLSGVGQ